jgi:hypothetical protein
MSPELLKVVERAKKDPNAQMYSLARLIDPDALRRAFARIRKNAAAGVDGVTKEQYEQRLEENVQALHSRLKAGQWGHQPIQRVHIPKAPGRTRLIGISCIEDKMVQGALTEVMAAIYEQDFLPCSFGFRHGRNAHGAIRALDAMVFCERLVWILEADIQAYFDSLNRTKLEEMLQLRVADKSFQGLPASTTHDPSADLGRNSMSLVSGGAGWWKSPCPDLRGLRVGNCPGPPERPATTSMRACWLQSRQEATVPSTGLRRIQPQVSQLASTV